MKTMTTMITERGQISIPAAIRRSLGVGPGERLEWTPAGKDECLVRRLKENPVKGAMAMRGYAKRFRATRPTADWLRELRVGESG